MWRPYPGSLFGFGGAGFGRMGAAVGGTAALAMLGLWGNEGLALFSIDNSLAIISSSDATDNYSGDPVGKLTTTRASTATYWDSDGLLKSAANNVLRRDFDPRLASTLERCGYLTEETRTNLLLRSEEFDNASWTKGGATISANAAVAPDGNTTADALIEGVAGTTKRASQAATISSGNTVALSIFAKANTRGEILLGLLSGSNYVTTYFTLSGAGTIRTSADNLGAIFSARSASIISCGNGWYRCTIIATTAGITSVSCLCDLSDGSSNNYSGDGASNAYIWGAQAEVGSFASSYIPTTSATVTRAADLVTLAGTLFPLSQTEGTLYAKFAPQAISVSIPEWVLSLDGGSASETNSIYRQTNKRPAFYIADGGVSQLGTSGLSSTATLEALTQGKVAAAYKLNDSAAALIGETVQTDIICTMPTTTQFVFGNRGGTDRALNGWLFEVAYFPTRKNNSQLQALASGWTP